MEFRLLSESSTSKRELRRVSVGGGLFLGKDFFGGIVTGTGGSKIVVGGLQKNCHGHSPMGFKVRGSLQTGNVVVKGKAISFIFSRYGQKSNPPYLR